MAFQTSKYTRGAKDSKIASRLKCHGELMALYQRQGMTREEASKEAYDVVAGMTAAEIEQYNREIVKAGECGREHR